MSTKELLIEKIMQKERELSIEEAIDAFHLELSELVTAAIEKQLENSTEEELINILGDL